MNREKPTETDAEILARVNARMSTRRKRSRQTTEAETQPADDGGGNTPPVAGMERAGGPP